MEEQTPTKKDPTPLPIKKLCVICCIILSESFSITMIFPFIANMISDFGVAGTEAELGFYAGLVASTFNFAQFLSAFIWGVVSDRVGRRPVLLLGLLGNFISILLFGFSPTLWFAIMARAINGILNGNVGVAKCYVLEISDDSNSTKAFSAIGLTYGVGVVIGPAIGGFLSRPHEKAPNIFPPGSFWEEFPYLLPCIVSTFINLVGLIFGWFVLTETLQIKLAKSDESIPLLKEVKVTDEDVPLDSERDIVEKDSPKHLWTEALHGVWVSAALYSILAFATIGTEEVFSVWSVNSVDLGGLKFTSEQVGIMFIVSGISLGIAQIFLVPFVIDKFGALRSFQVFAFFYAPFTILIPFLNLLTPYGDTVVTVACVILFVIRAVLDIVVFTCVFLFVNHSVNPNLVGAANGIAQSLASLARGFGPLLGGIMLTWSLSNGIGFPFDHYFTYFVMGLCLWIMFALSFLLTPAINIRKTGS